MTAVAVNSPIKFEMSCWRIQSTARRVTVGSHPYIGPLPVLTRTKTEKRFFAEFSTSKDFAIPEQPYDDDVAV